MRRWIRRWWRQRQRKTQTPLILLLRGIAVDQAAYMTAVRHHLLHDDAWNVEYEELNDLDRRLWDEVFR